MRSGTLTFAPGATAQTVVVPVVGDTLDELNETFVLNLSNATNATIAVSQGIATIIDNEPAASFRVNNASVIEGDGGTTTLTFTVTLTPGSWQTATVNFATVNGTASAPGDYASAPARCATLGVTTQTVAVTFNPDTANESNERLFISLSGAVNATIADGSGVG